MKYGEKREPRGSRCFVSLGRTAILTTGGVVIALVFSDFAGQIQVEYRPNYLSISINKVR